MNPTHREVCLRCGGIRTLRGRIGVPGELYVDRNGVECIPGYWEMPSTYCRGHSWRVLKKGEYI